jgi:phosphate starvation-inducible PhoH-like protein
MRWADLARANERSDLMNTHPALVLEPRSREIYLPAELRERLLAERNGLIDWIEDATSPFYFRLSETPNGVRIEGDEVAVMLAAKILERIGEASGEARQTDPDAVKAMISSVVNQDLRHDLAFRLEGLSHPVRPMSLGQVAFMRELLSKGRPLIFGLGPTGTGKTHLAITAGLNLLAQERVKHMVITRPHVVMEGEIVTPASRQEIEYDEQFNVFEDILRDLVGYKGFSQLVERRMLEITPLGRMRGRTFNDSYIVIDEAQNMTLRKMRMAVTRIGQGSRMVVTGDPAQIDLRGEEQSGLSHLLQMIDGKDIATVHRFESSQIIRNQIVARLEELYSLQGDAVPAFAA